MKKTLGLFLLAGCLSTSAAFASGLNGSYQLVSGSDAYCPNGDSPAGIQVLANGSTITITESILYGSDGIVSLTDYSLPLGSGYTPGTENVFFQITGAGTWNGQLSADGMSYNYAFTPTDPTDTADANWFTFKLVGNNLVTDTNMATTATGEQTERSCTYTKISNTKISK